MSTYSLLTFPLVSMWPPLVLGAHQVAILTPYSGQVVSVRRELCALSTPGVADVRAATIDAFRGEQADVLILSLVRSKPTGEGTGTLDIGALDSEARAAIALARTRRGLYLIGNAEARGGAGENQKP